MDDAQKNDSNASSSLRLVRVGGVNVGISEAEVLTLIDWREPSTIPFAPPTVLGVIAVQGRMFTVLDTARLLGVDSDLRNPIVALRGREQLALAVSATGEEIRVQATDINPPVEFLCLSKGTIKRDGRIIHILATEKLFGIALQGHERRRRRF